MQMVTSVSDLGLAAALVSREFGVLETQREDKGRTSFIFSDSPELQEAVKGYWANTLDVKARYYFDAIKMLKSRIYGEK